MQYVTLEEMIEIVNNGAYEVTFEFETGVGTLIARGKTVYFTQIPMMIDMGFYWSKSPVTNEKYSRPIRCYATYTRMRIAVDPETNRVMWVCNCATHTFWDVFYRKIVRID